MSDNSEVQGIHPVELSVYSLVSSDLDNLYQAINELRESQALLILKLRTVRDSLRLENELLFDSNEYKAQFKELNNLQKRLQKITLRLKDLERRSSQLTTSS